MNILINRNQALSSFFYKYKNNFVFILQTTSRQGNVRTKLNKVAIKFGEVHLRDLPQVSSSPDIRPDTASLEVLASPTPRYLSAPSARFSYDGLDLTGVIRTR